MASPPDYDLDSIEPRDLGRLVDPDHFLEHGYPYETWARLREERPVALVEPHNSRPFWAITRHEDIRLISKNPQGFIVGPRLMINIEDPSTEEGIPGVRMLLNMDPPEHGDFRQLVSRNFTPRAISALEPRTREITRRLLSEFGGGGAVCRGDFVAEVAARIPLAIIAEFLGLPEEDWDQLFDWTNLLAAASDPEFAKGRTYEETMQAAAGQFFAYFTDLAAKRRAQPTDDVMSQLLAAKLNGKPLDDFQLGSYLILLFTAGTETTRNAMAGGLAAWMEYPEQFERLRSDRTLLQSATEEILRWTAPVTHFVRTATDDFNISGQKIAKGESVALFYPAANRDPRVFENPDSFQVDRARNPHYTFGIGEHVCLGAPVARLEIQILFDELLNHMDRCEATATASRLRALPICGYRDLPIEYHAKVA